MANELETASDHQVWELLKLQDAEAWKLVWVRAVLPEAQSFRSGRKAQEWGITAEEMMSLLYVEMIGGHKIDLYRDDGGSLWGWLRTYVRGYIHRSRPDERLVSIEGAGAEGSEDDDGRSFEEKVSKQVSDSRGRESLPDEDPVVRRREEWALVQKCFGDLWKKNPIRAYVHLLKTRFFFSSEEVKDFLDVSSAANVDQIFSRNVKFMRKAWMTHEAKWE